MATMQQEPNTTSGVRPATPPQRYSAAVKFIDKAMDRDPNPTSVESMQSATTGIAMFAAATKGPAPWGPIANSKRSACRISAGG